ncbi:ADP-ribosylation factor GTPase-activating protein AGD5-like isoform X2 [Mercurialis annua]|nr:ADP-ribosylation factor GTPase-activating protein AGD5-like isoform X2 [Mercurialis annua]
MGNEKSNSYWEAELPHNYDRVGIENFIRAKYVDKRWVPREGKATSPSRMSVEKAAVYKPGPESTNNKQMNSVSNASEVKKSTSPPITKNNNPPKISTPQFVTTSQQVKVDPKPQEPVQKLEPAVTNAELVKEEKITPIVKPAKVDYATELFNLLCMDDSSGTSSKASLGDNAWVGFQNAKVESISGGSDATSLSESRINSEQEAENFFKDPPPTGKPKSDAKNDIMNLFEKSSTVSPVSVHQQQFAMPTQQQQVFMAAAVKSSGGIRAFPPNVQNIAPNGTYTSSNNWGHQVPGMTTPATGDVQKYFQIGNNQQSYSAGNSVNIPVSSTYRPGSMVPKNGATNIGSTMPPPSFPVAQPQPQVYYDLSYLTQVMSAKR